MKLVVGTYTRPAPYLGTTNGKGVSLYEVSATGKLTYLSTIEGIDNPSFVAVHPNGRFVYAHSEVWGWHEGIVTALLLEGGKFEYLNKQSAMGSICAQCIVEPGGRYLLIANYWDGYGIAMLPLLADGRLAPASDVHRHEGAAMTIAARQDKSHPHCIIVDDANQYALVSDLGTDQIVTYRLDYAAGKLVRYADCALEAGSGPRHIVFHPSGKTLYSINELSSTVTQFSYADGRLTLGSSVSTVPDSAHENHCSEIQLTADGRFLYAGNRGHDSIAAFRVDASNHTLTPVGHFPTGGRTPRNFVVAPDGSFLLVGNQDSDTIVTFRIHPQTGALEATGDSIESSTPVCLKFVG